MLDLHERKLLDRGINPCHSDLIDGFEPTQDPYNLFPYLELPLSDRDVQNFQEVIAIRFDRKILEAEG